MMRLLHMFCALAIPILAGCSQQSAVTIGAQSPESHFVSTNEHLVKQISTGQNGVNLLIITNEKLQQQPELDLRKQLPPLDHARAVMLAVDALRKQYTMENYFINHITLERLIPDRDDPTWGPGWNWYKGRFFWCVGISWYENREGALSLYGYDVTRGVLMTGEIIEPVERQKK